MTGQPCCLLEEFGTCWDFGLEKRLNECFKCDLMGHTSRSMDNDVASNASCEVPSQEVSEGKDINNWSRELSCVILA